MPSAVFKYFEEYMEKKNAFAASLYIQIAFIIWKLNVVCPMLASRWQTSFGAMNIYLSNEENLDVLYQYFILLRPNIWIMSQ